MDGRSKTSAKNGKLGGRPLASSTLISQKIRAQFAEWINEDPKRWFDSMDDAANGHFIEKMGPDGKVKVYRKSPDPQAWEKLMNRAFGQPKIEIEQKPDEETKEVIANMGEEVTKLREEYESKLKEQLKKNV